MEKPKEHCWLGREIAPSGGPWAAPTRPRRLAVSRGSFAKGGAWPRCVSTHASSTTGLRTWGVERPALPAAASGVRWCTPLMRISCRRGNGLIDVAADPQRRCVPDRQHFLRASALPSGRCGRCPPGVSALPPRLHGYAGLALPENEWLLSIVLAFPLQPTGASECDESGRGKFLQSHRI